MKQDSKEQRDALQKQLEEDRADHPGKEIGLPENLRVVFGEEYNPQDG